MAKKQKNVKTSSAGVKNSEVRQIQAAAASDKKEAAGIETPKEDNKVQEVKEPAPQKTAGDNPDKNAGGENESRLKEEAMENKNTKKNEEGNEINKPAESVITRKTKETSITLGLRLNGAGNYDVNTGVGFFDHMLEGFAKHGNFDLRIIAKGDLNVDCHHTVEDVGIVLGQAIKNAVGNKEGINRYASFIQPMDDALVLVSVDLCNRTYLNFDYEFKTERVGYFETETVKEFFRAVADEAGMNIHIKVLDGTNTHHIIEATFKAFANALAIAVSKNGRVGVLSTKGAL